MGAGSRGTGDDLDGLRQEHVLDGHCEGLDGGGGGPVPGGISGLSGR